jgi:AhpD family alkylhydroperoxidase
MAGSPAALEGYSNLSKTFFAKTLFTTGEQNLILLSSSLVNQCQYCITAHMRGAKQNGIPSKTINQIRKQLPVTDEKVECTGNIY